MIVPHSEYYQQLIIHEKIFLNNLRILQEYYQKPLGVVVKGNAYGHGLLETARLFVKAGIARLICYHLADAVTLRAHYPELSLLLIGPITLEEVEICRKQRIELTIWDLSFYKAVLNRASQRSPEERKISVHIEIETGMHRTGIQMVGLLTEAKELIADERINLLGFSTHLSGADEEENVDRVYEQIQNFKIFKRKWQEMQSFQNREWQWHGPNSAGLLVETADIFTHARVGILAYGFFPSTYSQSRWPAGRERPEPALEWTSRIAGYQYIPRGRFSGYGKSYKTKKALQTVMIPTGYGDGFPRGLSNDWCVKIEGIFCPVIGRVNMNQIIVDISEVRLNEKEASVTLIERNGEYDWYSASKRSGRFIYELLTGISTKITRRIK